MTRIKLKHGSANVDTCCSKETIDALNEVSILAFEKSKAENRLEELSNLASFFSENYKTLSCNQTFTSKEGNYKIEYLEKNPNEDTLARFGHTSKVIQISHNKLNKLKNVDSDLIFYLVLWCGFGGDIGDSLTSTEQWIKLDTMVFNFFIETGRDKLKLFKNISKLYVSEFDLAKKRILNLKELLK